MGNGRSLNLRSCKTKVTTKIEKIDAIILSQFKVGIGYAVVTNVAAVIENMSSRIIGTFLINLLYSNPFILSNQHAI